MPGCFTMALSGQMTSAELTPESIETTAVVTMEKTDDGPSVTKIHLVTKVKAPNAREGKVRRAGERRRRKGARSRGLLKAAEITLDASLI